MINEKGIWPGWHPIIRQYQTRIRYLRSGDCPVRLIKATEKLGALRVYCNDDHTQSTVLQSHWLGRLDEWARRLSLRTCDQCGVPGRLRHGIRLQTLCDEHAFLVGQPRPEDGRVLDADHERLIDGVVVEVRKRPFNDAELGLDPGRTWDYEAVFRSDFRPMLSPICLLPDDDAVLQELHDKLIAVDKARGQHEDICFMLSFYKPSSMPDRVDFTSFDSLEAVDHDLSPDEMAIRAKIVYEDIPNIMYGEIR